MPAIFSLHSALMRYAVCAVCCFLLCSCIALQGRKGPAPGGKRHSASAIKARPEAEKFYTEAVALWQHPLGPVSAAQVSAAPEKAVTLLDQAIALEPAYAEAHAWRGLAKSELGLREEAFDDLTTSIRLRPSPETYAYRALVSLRSGQRQAAKRDLDYALEHDPSNAVAHNYMGLLALDGGNKAEACAYFKKGCSNGDCSFLDSARSEKICP